MSKPPEPCYYEPPIWGIEDWSALPGTNQPPTYLLSARRIDTGEPALLTINMEANGVVTYREYWTGPTPWWKRALRRLRIIH